MRYFLKTVLEKDQRVLMKLKSKECVSSCNTDDPDLDTIKKKLNKKQINDINHLEYTY